MSSLHVAPHCPNQRWCIHLITTERAFLTQSTAATLIPLECKAQDAATKQHNDRREHIGSRGGARGFCCCGGLGSPVESFPNVTVHCEAAWYAAVEAEACCVVLPSRRSIGASGAAALVGVALGCPSAPTPEC